MIPDRNSGLPIVLEAAILLWQGKNAPDFDGDMEALTKPGELQRMLGEE